MSRSLFVFYIVESPKLLFYSSLLLAGISSCAEPQKAKTKYSDLRRENIKGDVQLMRTTFYNCDSTGKIGEMQDCCSTLMEYNEDGNLIKQTSTNKEGKITEEETTTIHKNGLRTSVTTIRDGKKTRYMVLDVNDAGQYYAGKVFDSADKLQMYYEDMLMNEHGQPVSFTLYAKDSSIIMKEEAKYDGNKLLSYFQTNKEGKQIARFENKFNAKGEMIESVTVEITDKGEQKSVRKYTYDKYDSQGNCTQTTNWDGQGKATGILKIEFTYRK
jgi:hypothetical protein